MQKYGLKLTDTNPLSPFTWKSKFLGEYFHLWANVKLMTP